MYSLQQVDQFVCQLSMKEPNAEKQHKLVNLMLSEDK